MGDNMQQKSCQWHRSTIMKIVRYFNHQIEQIARSIMCIAFIITPLLYFVRFHLHWHIPCAYFPDKIRYYTGMEDEICPYATFHLLGFREEMDPTKAMNFQTFPHQNGTATPGHTGTMGTGTSNAHMMHSRSGSQSMVSDICSKWFFFVAFDRSKNRFAKTKSLTRYFRLATPESICT